MKKRLMSMLLVGAMVLAMTACGSSNDSGSSTDSSTENSADSSAEDSTDSGAEGSSEESSSADADVSDLKVGIIMKSSDEFQNAVVQGATDAAIEAGISKSNIKAVAPTSESDAYQQVTSVEDMISGGVDLLLISCQEENALSSVLQKAADAGIKVVMVDTDCSLFEDKVTYIGTDNYNAAYEGAKEFATHLEEGSNVVILRGKLGDMNHENRTDGLTAGLEESGMNVLEVQDANCETDKAASAMEAWLSKYQGEIDAVMVTSDSMAVGAATAIKGAGVEGIKVCGFDGFQAALSLFETSEIEMIIAQKPYEIGQDGMKDGLAALLDGETFDPYIDSGIAIIDADNYKDYLK